MQFGNFFYNTIEKFLTIRLIKNWNLVVEHLLVVCYNIKDCGQSFYSETTEKDICVRSKKDKCVFQ